MSENLAVQHSATLRDLMEKSRSAFRPSTRKPPRIGVLFSESPHRAPPGTSRIA